MHPLIKEAVAGADIAVHCGDFTRMDVVDGMRMAARKAVVVHGNTDPVERRLGGLAEERAAAQVAREKPGLQPPGGLGERRTA